jgi:hypothetical protein
MNRINDIDDLHQSFSRGSPAQNPSLLASLDLSTYSWMCCWSTGS